MKKIIPVSLDGLKTYSIHDRNSKVGTGDMAVPFETGDSFTHFVDSLPDILAARDIRCVADAVIEAHRSGNIVALGIGAHVVKVGLSPLIIDLMNTGVINAVAMNGAGIVHDFELSYAGHTSEDVDEEIDGGTFGMASETGSLINNAIAVGVDEMKGIGESVGELIYNSGYQFEDLSILAAGVRLGIPVTAHVAIGTDILHIHPQMDPAATGRGTHNDFKLFAGVVAGLDGGVYINMGSAVILPEVFLKALTLVRNQGHVVEKITTVNMDFIQHYRPVTNVVRRPTASKGKGYTITGHHEIMFPFLAAMIKEGMLK